MSDLVRPRYMLVPHLGADAIAETVALREEDVVARLARSLRYVQS
jgi:hypothetical protein